MEPQCSISVAICTFNSGRFLPRQLQSIEEQTLLPSEVFVCDDGSSDETLSILNDWKKHVPFSVNIVQNSETLGYTKNFEKAVTSCHGDVILLADHDDVWLSNRVETVCRWFDQDPELGLVTSDAQIIDSEGVDQNMTLRDFVGRMHLLDFWRFFIPSEVEPVLWTGCTMAIRRRFLERALPVPSSFACHDIWFYVAFALSSKIAFIPEPLIQYRLHGQNNSTAPTAAFLRANPSRWRYFSAFLETLDQHPFLIEELEKYASHLPETPRITAFLRALRRHERHFCARNSISRHPWNLLRELLNGGYFAHPQPFRSFLYDLREWLRTFHVQKS